MVDSSHGRFKIYAKKHWFLLLFHVLIHSIYSIYIQYTLASQGAANPSNSDDYKNFWHHKQVVMIDSFHGLFKIYPKKHWCLS